MDSNCIYFLFLFPLAIIGMACSYTDIKYNKIFNKWIILGLIYVLCLYIFLFFLEEKTYVLKLILNGTVAFSLGYLLWSFRLWSAGDAKLFTLYALLIPLDFYSKSYISYFPAFNLLINLFIPLLLVLIASALITTLKKLYKIKYEKKLKFPETRKIFQVSLFLFHLFLTYVFIFTILNSIIIPLTRDYFASEVFENPFFIAILLFLTISSFNRKRKEKKWLNWVFYGVIFGYASLLIFSGDLQRLISTLKVALVFMVFVGLTRIILDFYIRKREIKKIKIKNIKEGMIPVKDNFFVFINKLKENFGFLDAGGLTENQVELIKEYFKNDQELEIKTYKTFPFAPFLFLSAIISVLTQNSFLVLLDKIFQYLLS